MFLHIFGAVLQPQENRTQVYVQGQIPLFLRGGKQISCLGNAGIIDQNIDPAPLFIGLGQELLHGFLLAHIAADQKDFGPVGFCQAGRFPGLLANLQVIDNQSPAAGFGHFHGNGPPYPLGGPSYNDNFFFQGNRNHLLLPPNSIPTKTPFPISSNFSANFNMVSNMLLDIFIIFNHSPFRYILPCLSPDTMGCATIFIPFLQIKQVSGSKRTYE